MEDNVEPDVERFNEFHCCDFSPINGPHKCPARGL